MTLRHSRNMSVFSSPSSGNSSNPSIISSPNRIGTYKALCRCGGQGAPHLGAAADAAGVAAVAAAGAADGV